MPAFHRFNVSLDTLDPQKFKKNQPLGLFPQGYGRYRRCPEGRCKDQAQSRGTEGGQQGRDPDMVRFAHRRGMDSKPCLWARSRRAALTVTCRCWFCAKASRSVHLQRHSVQDRRYGPLCRSC